MRDWRWKSRGRSGAFKSPGAGITKGERGNGMKRYLMCAEGAARIVEVLPERAEFLDTVAVSGTERYRVFRGEKELFATPLPPWGAG